MPQKRKPLIRIIASLLIIAVFAGACYLHLSTDPTVNTHLSELQDTVQQAVTTETTAQGNIVVPDSIWYLPTAPEDWYAVGDTVNWNDRFTFCVENVSIGKELPEGAELSELIGVSEAYGKPIDENGTLTGGHIYVDVTTYVTCTALKAHVVYGVEMEPPGSAELTLHSHNLTFFDTETAQPAMSGEPALTQNLSPEYDLDYHLRLDMKPGMSIRMRNIFVIRESDWNSRTTAVLFTPYAPTYKRYELEASGLSQPHIRLNEKDVKI